MPRSMLNMNPQINPENEGPLQPVQEQAVPVQAQPAPVRRSAQYEQPAAPVMNAQDQYANAFPAWDLVPPQIIVRRVKRNR